MQLRSSVEFFVWFLRREAGLSEEFEREFEAETLIVKFIESEEEGDVEQVVAHSVAHFGVVGLSGGPQLAEVEAFAEDVAVGTGLHEAQ